MTPNAARDYLKDLRDRINHACARAHNHNLGASYERRAQLGVDESDATTIQAISIMILNLDHAIRDNS